MSTFPIEMSPEVLRSIIDQSKSRYEAMEVMIWDTLNDPECLPAERGLYKEVAEQISTNFKLLSEISEKPDLASLSAEKLDTAFLAIELGDAFWDHICAVLDKARTEE